MSEPQPATPSAHVEEPAGLSGPRLGVHFGLTLVGAIAGLLIMDAVAGSFVEAREVETKGALMEHPALAWTNRPGYSDEKTLINSIGLRGEEIPDDAPADEVRILGCGASRCYGAGVDGPNWTDTWSEHLGRMLEARDPKSHWRVLNGGVVGYSALQAARRAELLIEETQPDLIVLFVSGSAQMLLDPSSSALWVRVGNDLVPSDIAQAVPERLLPAAVAVHAFLSRFNLYKRYRSRIAFGGLRTDDVDSFVMTTHPIPNPRIATMLHRTFEEIAHLKRVATERGIEVRALVLLDAYQCEEERWNRFLKKGVAKGAPPPGTSRTDSIVALTKTLEAVGIESWNVVTEQDFIESKRGRYLCDHAHWTSEGHAMIARGILKQLEEDELHVTLPKKRASAPRPRR